MNTNKPFNTWRCYALPLPLLFICFLLLLSACSPLRPAVNAYFAGDAAKAREKIQRVKAPHELPAANYIEAMLNAAETNETVPLLAITNDLCVAEKEIKALPLKKIHRLARYGIRPGLVRQSNANLRNRIFNLMTSGSTVSELLYLMDSVACWPASTIDSLSREITNRTLDSTKSVIGLPDDKWTAPQLAWPSKEEIAEEPGRSFLALVPQASRGVTYVDATAIENRLADKVEARNYPAYWEIKREIFDLFQVGHRYCEMDRFRTDHPLNYYALDCNYETAKDTLCLGELKPLLQFHRNNPHTALDWTICLQAIYLEVVDRTAANLSGEEAKQLQDIHLMLDLRSQINSCDPDLDPAAVLKDISYLAKAYPYHKVVYELAKELLLLLIDNGQLEAARNSLTTLQPLYADSAVCVPGYSFQVGKQAWFRYFDTHLTRFEDYVAKLGELQLPEPMLAWNTDDNHEHSMVSYGETDEAYFVRQPIKGGAAKVMRSQRKGGKWSAPTVVRQLSQGYRIRLHSMSGNGQQILLSIDGVLHQSYRPAIGRPWLKPDELPMGERFAGDAWLSPDDSLLLLTYYAEELSPSYEPQRQLAVARLDASGGYRQARLLEEPINVEGIDIFRPSMALGGRMLFLAADHDDSMGGTDMYSINMSQPANWNSAKASQNLGLPMNSLRDDEGISYMSEYSGYAYFQRNNGCLASDDIYRYRMAPEIFPEALRLAGLVVDENGDPLGGGFMEFTPNFQLNVHALALSDNGTYVYTVADSTEVVRLFPEVPGYYSEQDATHYLSEVGKGEIIRDTFRLVSFDYIRENFKLEHSTFYHNTAQFDQANKAYPEITRLAKIAVRMGADLELIGHTDEVGSAADNKQLSLNRARSVRNYLVEKCGFDPARIRVEGKGATEPICPNDTEEGRRCNRRIEILFRMPELVD